MNSFIEDKRFDLKLLKKRFTDWEGLVLKAYKCPTGYISVGIGRNLETRGITEDEANYLLENDIRSVFKDLDKHLPVWRKFPLDAQYVFIDLCFNLGIQTLLSFRKTIAYCEMGDWLKASKELLRSKYRDQVGRRAIFNSEELAKCQEKVIINKIITTD